VTGAVGPIPGRTETSPWTLSHRIVAEIAARWGFRSAAHFTRAFRARYGMVPVELRRLASCQRGAAADGR
jgi:AraC-like DNA-binding protein